jgi:hypothetical protein
MLEKYLDIAIMTVLNTHAWIQYPHVSFWGSPWNVINSICNIILIVYLIVYPLYAFIVIRMAWNKGELDSEENMERVGILYEEQRYSTLHGATFNIREMLRRLLMVLAITVFNGIAFFQIVSLTILSMLTLMAFSHMNVFHTKANNRLHFANEFIVYTCMWSSVIFQMKTTKEANDIVGWFYILSGLLMVIGSIVVIFYE